MTERTFIIIKPDGVRKNLIGDVLGRFERAGLVIKALRMTELSRDIVERHYAEHKERSFYIELVEFLISGPVVLGVLEGDNAIARTREIVGATDFRKAKPGTIRADHAETINHNVVHASDSIASAEREMALFGMV